METSSLKWRPSLRVMKIPRSIISPLTIRSDPSYHVSQPKLVHGESRAIPRTSTSSSILGCMLGFGDIGRGYLINALDSKNDNTIFIYKMDYDLAVKPSKDLVPDVDYTDEHWLIASSVKTREYTGSIIGKDSYLISVLIFYVMGRSITIRGISS